MMPFECFSEKLTDCVSVEITPSVLSSLYNAGISFSWHLKDFDNKKGWLADIARYQFQYRFTVEGPSGLYGGSYDPNHWTSGGGMCQIGAASYAHSPLPEGMQIGRYCSIGKGLRFLDFAHPTQWLSSSIAFFRPQGVETLSSLHAVVDRVGLEHVSGFSRRYFDAKQGKSYPVLEHDVWIGESVTLALGIRIGTGAVIASGAIVTGDVPPYAIVAGVPAEVRKYRFSEPLCDMLLQSQWWHYHFADLNCLDFQNPEKFVQQLAERIEAGQINVWKPKILILPDDLLPEVRL